ncbi:MAG: peptide chain release factor N(5)-glutamine methyltransferase [Persephonella sp.]|nr:MAG: peptide chain release factor N(5)-glutamine methyltransferase [Persephonella sp.]
MKLSDILKISIDILKNSGVETPITDTHILISYVLKIPRWKIITEKERILSSEEVENILKVINKRASGVPVAYIIKKKEFFGIKFYVDERVLIPRPETEILVEKVLEKLKDKKDKLVGLDIGVGSGAISIALLKNIPNLYMFGVDVSEDALKVANINSELKLTTNKLKLVKSNIFSNLDRNIKFDFIVSNPPYISRKDYLNLKVEVKKEPKVALISGKEGLSFYERIIKEGKNFLKGKGFIAFEVGYNQSKKVKGLFLKNDFKDIEIYKDLNGIDRVVIGFIK